MIRHFFALQRYCGSLENGDVYLPCMLHIATVIYAISEVCVSIMLLDFPSYSDQCFAVGDKLFSVHWCTFFLKPVHTLFINSENCAEYICTVGAYFIVHADDVLRQQKLECFMFD